MKDIEKGHIGLPYLEDDDDDSSYCSSVNELVGNNDTDQRNEEAEPGTIPTAFRLVHSKTDMETDR